MKFELLVGAPAFWERAAADIATARRRVLVQAMTFEADAAGQPVAAAIGASRASDRRVLVDDYSRLVVSDRWVAGRQDRLSSELKQEVAATRAMFLDLLRSGVSVRLTNPIGRLFTNYPARNHKKLIVADDTAYIGGINFSDHNFAWHDFMLRIEGVAAADWLAEDFGSTFAGRPRAAGLDLRDARFWSLDGRGNAAAFGELMAMIAAARRRITVISPYLTFPVTGALSGAARRGVQVQLITPWPNNKPIVRDSLLWTAQRSGFEIVLLDDMIHLKGMVIDGACLVVGSSNFDFVSLAAEEEFMAAIADPAVIADFEARIVAPALARALPAHAHRIDFGAGVRAGLALRLAQAVAMSARGARRTAVDWPLAN